MEKLQIKISVIKVRGTKNIETSIESKKDDRSEKLKVKKQTERNKIKILVEKGKEGAFER